MSKSIPKSTKTAVLNDYRGKVLTVPQIAQKYGISRRTIYSWVTEPDRQRGNGTRKAIYLSPEEVETLLLLIMIGDGKMTDSWTGIAKNIETRLLDMADYFTEIKESKR